jgi:HSP20 family protein
VPTDRDLFANFERMRREMDELFGDVFGAGPVRRGAFTPAIDVYYVADPPRAVVRAELAGIRAAEIELEIRGRELIIAGQRRGAEPEEERVYQQLEIQHGPFRRVVSLGADVDPDAAKATFEDGVLTVELAIRAPQGARQVPIRRAGEDPSS